MARETHTQYIFSIAWRISETNHPQQQQEQRQCVSSAAVIDLIECRDACVFADAAAANATSARR